MARILSFGVILLVFSGCARKIEEQTKATGSIFGKKTQQVTKFDPAAGKEVQKGELHYTDPISGPLQGYRAALERLEPAVMDHAIALYEAEHGRKPKDYKEFMEKIIKAN